MTWGAVFPQPPLLAMWMASEGHVDGLLGQERDGGQVLCASEGEQGTPDGGWRADSTAGVGHSRLGRSRHTTQHTQLVSLCCQCGEGGAQATLAGAHSLLKPGRIRDLWDPSTRFPSSLRPELHIQRSLGKRGRSKPQDHAAVSRSRLCPSMATLWLVT